MNMLSRTAVSPRYKHASRSPLTKSHASRKTSRYKPPSAEGCFFVRVEIAASLYRNTISGPHERIVGNGECSIRFTVARRVSDQLSIGPRGVSDHLCIRMRPANSLSPVIKLLARAVGV